MKKHFLLNGIHKSFLSLIGPYVHQCVSKFLLDWDRVCPTTPEEQLNLKHVWKQWTFFSWIHTPRPGENMDREESCSDQWRVEPGLLSLSGLPHPSAKICLQILGASLCKTDCTLLVPLYGSTLSHSSGLQSGAVKPLEYGHGVSELLFVFPF